MFKLTVDGKEYEAKVTFYTALLYEQEFGRDMLKDFIGVQTLDDDSSGTLSIDFTKVNWTAATKVLWAAMKTASDSTEPDTIWVKKAGGVNMWLINEQLGMEIGDCFFRTEAPGEEA